MATFEEEHLEAEEAHPEAGAVAHLEEAGVAEVAAHPEVADSIVVEVEVVAAVAAAAFEVVVEVVHHQDH